MTLKFGYPGVRRGAQATRRCDGHPPRGPQVYHLEHSDLYAARQACLESKIRLTPIKLTSPIRDADLVEVLL